MKSQEFITCLAFAALASPLMGQESPSDEANRSKYALQFDQLDMNDDGNLDETERQNLSAAELEAFQSRGIPERGLVSRDAFITAGVATPVTPPDSAKMEDAKPVPGTVPSLGFAPGVIVRNSFRRGTYVPGLPAEYSSRDKNGDGQIALYEWDRKKLSEFTKLDKNGDGFLTPRELLPKETLQALYSRSTRPVASVTPSAFQAPGLTGVLPATAMADSDAISKEAIEKFNDLDSSKDGQIDEKEWGNSRRTRGLIESTGVKVTFPLNPETFASHYRLARASQQR
ncbi:MAG: hypothetical protein JSS49_04170 [Planctomycetes bacterium]|nr:hypothetical protein [Planctomycetota bacterium]